MPATEATWRNQKLLHVVFGWSSLIMLLATIWMFANDHQREWKDYQRQFRDIDLTYSEWQLRAEEARLASLQLEQIRSELDELRATPPPPGTSSTSSLRRCEQTRSGARSRPPIPTSCENHTRRLQQARGASRRRGIGATPTGRRPTRPESGLLQGSSAGRPWPDELRRPGPLSRKPVGSSAQVSRGGLRRRPGRLWTCWSGMRHRMSELAAAQQQVESIRGDLDELSLQRERATAHRPDWRQLLQRVVGSEQELEKTVGG